MFKSSEGCLIPLDEILDSMDGFFDSMEGMLVFMWGRLDPLEGMLVFMRGMFDSLDLAKGLSRAVIRENVTILARIRLVYST